MRYFIALIWFVNGFYCKLLNQVPRHQEIVGRILGEDYAPFLTKLIGIAEIIMTVWVLSRWESRFNAIVQIVVIATMNLLEFVLVPDLLLWGRFNSIFAFCFILLIYWHEFKKSSIRS